MYRLTPELTQRLLQSPESGMGFQYVEVTETNGARRDGVAYNADLVAVGQDVANEKMTRTRYETLLKSAASAFGQIRDIRVIERPSSTRFLGKSASASTGEAKNATIEMTKASEVFKRFSAYANDRRVHTDGSLLAGTYATTEADAKHATTGSQAVARYALPNPQPASQVFTSAPAAKTQVQRGAVAPANSQPGGGVEVIFPSGTQAGTTSGPVKIPD